MILVVKILFVAFAVFGQAKLFQEKPVVSAVAGGLDTLMLPEDKPELVLARRAMEAQGLCRAYPGPGEVNSAPADSSTESEEDGIEAADARQGFANNCF